MLLPSGNQFVTPPFLTEKDINTAVNLLTTHSYAGCLDLIRSRFHDTENLPFTIKVVKAICLDNLGKQIEANQIIQSLSVTDQFWCRRAFHDHVEQSIFNT